MAYIIGRKLSYDDVFLVPRYSEVISRSHADLSWKITNYTFNKNGVCYFKSPIIPANMDTISGFKMIRKTASLGGLGIHHRYCSVDEYKSVNEQWRKLNDKECVDYPLAVSVGSIHTVGETERIDWAINNAEIICIDIAHGNSSHMRDTIRYIRDRNLNTIIIAGNVATSDAVLNLATWGANIAKVGIAAGGVCTTAIKTGCYMPQFSAVQDCVNANSIPIIADGGIKTAGCAAKALAAGAIAVMAGSLFAGTDCVPGWDEAVDKYKEEIKKSESLQKPHIVYRGMASKEARKSFNHEGNNAEGVSRQVQVKPEGSTAEIFTYLHEGISSAMSYSNAKNLSEFKTNALFSEVTHAGLGQAHPHFKDH